MFFRVPFQKVTIGNNLSFETGDGILRALEVTLSEQERASSCEITLSDDNLDYLNLFLTQFIDQGGILIPLGLLEKQEALGGGSTVQAAPTAGTGTTPSTLAAIEAKYGASDLGKLNAAGQAALENLKNVNVIAFLNAVAVAELGDTAASAGGYGILFGDTGGKETFTIAQLANGHPGQRRTSGGITSSATGRFQVLDVVYAEEAAKLGLKDFKPISQWIIAADRLAYRQVVEDVKAGNIEKAITGNGGTLSAKAEWASLGSYGQGTQAGKLNNFLANYKQFLAAASAASAAAINTDTKTTSTTSTISSTDTTSTSSASAIPSNKTALASVGGSTSTTASEIDISQGVVIVIEEGFNDDTPSIQTQFILTGVKGESGGSTTKISGKQVRYLLAKGSAKYKVHKNTSIKQLATAIASNIGANIELPDNTDLTKINAAITQQETDYKLLLKLAQSQKLLLRGSSDTLKLVPLTVDDPKIILEADVLLFGSSWGEEASSDRLIKGQAVAATNQGSSTPIAGVSVGSGGNGTVSVGGVFTPQIDAFMDLIAWKEVSDGLGIGGYYENNGVGGSTGKFTTSDIQAGGGFPASAGSSYNVGRYQFNRGDWTEAKKTFPQITGYSPADQDLVCLWKLGYRNCVSALARGDILTAIRNGNKEWASLPGSPYGQVQAGYTESMAVAYYNQRLAYYNNLTTGGSSSGSSASTTPATAASNSAIPSNATTLAGVTSSSTTGQQGILDLNTGTDPTKGIGKGFTGVLNVDLLKQPSLISVQPGMIVELAGSVSYGDAIRRSRRISEVKRSYSGGAVQCSLNIYIPVAVKQKTQQGGTASTAASATAGTNSATGAAVLFSGNFNDTPKSGDNVGGHVVTSPFGNRSSPGGVGTTNHKGCDFAFNVGTPIYATLKDGETVKVTWLTIDQSGGGGNVAVFDYGGFTFLCMHCSAVYPGTRKHGETIALTGNTGNSTGPHLHIGQKKGGEYVAPQRGFCYWIITGNMPAT